ncbi:TolC family outer membrane protein [soil metagenome]
MTVQRFLLVSATALVLAAPAAVVPAHADTLREALVKAYRSNPALNGARAGQRANDENVPLQKAAGRPNLVVGGDYTESVVRSNSFQARRTASADGTLTVPIYSGGAVRNGITAAKRRVEAGQASLRGTEASIFAQVVAAYMDVIRDSAIVSLNRANVSVLDVNLQATNDRFEVGDLTRTDIAQSDSRLALARSDLQQAEANLIASRERYIALVGEAPVDLEKPPELPGLPITPDAAVAVALSDNPDILAAKKDREAALFDVRVARSSRLPTLSTFAQGSYSDNLGSLTSSVPGVVNQSTHSGAIGASLSVPIFQGGRPAALVRQSQALESQAIEREIEVERSVISQARAAYASWQASLQTIKSSRTAVDASALSLEGVRAENTVGSRTILDILNAEQETLISRVELVSAERNAYVAGFSLLAAMGHAEADDLGLEGGVLYNPVTNYERVRNKLSDWDDDPRPEAVSTRTVDTPAQNANVDAADAQ